MDSALPAPYWSVLEKFSLIIGLSFGALDISSNLKAQSSDRLRIVS